MSLTSLPASIRCRKEEGVTDCLHPPCVSKRVALVFPSLVTVAFVAPGCASATAPVVPSTFCRWVWFRFVVPDPGGFVFQFRLVSCFMGVATKLLLKVGEANPTFGYVGIVPCYMSGSCSIKTNLGFVGAIPRLGVSKVELICFVGVMATPHLNLFSGTFRIYFYETVIVVPIGGMNHVTGGGEAVNLYSRGSIHGESPSMVIASSPPMVKMGLDDGECGGFEAIPNCFFLVVSDTVVMIWGNLDNVVTSDLMWNWCVCLGWIWYQDGYDITHRFPPVDE